MEKYICVCVWCWLLQMDRVYVPHPSTSVVALKNNVFRVRWCCVSSCLLGSSLWRIRTRALQATMVDICSGSTDSPRTGSSDMSAADDSSDTDGGADRQRQTTGSNTARTTRRQPSMRQSRAHRFRGRCHSVVGSLQYVGWWRVWWLRKSSLRTRRSATV